MRRQQPQQPSQEEQIRAQQVDREHANAQSTAHQVAAQGSSVEDLQENADFGEFISKPDIERDPEYLPEDEQADIEQLLGAEFGRHLALGNISNKKAEKEELLDLARSLVTKAEFRPQSGPGHKCTSEDRQIMTGVENPKPKITPDRSRQISAAYEERSMARTLSKGGRAFRGMTEVIAETRSKGLDDDGSGGFLSSVKQGVFG